MDKMVILLLVLMILPQASRAEIVLVKSITQSDAVILFNDKKFVNKPVELVSIDGKVTVGKLRGTANSSLLVKNTPSVPICSVRLVRISEKTASRLRLGVAIFGGVVAGSLVGGPVALAIAFAGAETAGLATYATFPVIGGIIGSKLARKRKDSIFILDRDSNPIHCAGAQGVNEVPASASK
ncbi:MAG TPA: hypothetical protein VEX68_22550 [Bryobacteraceae bacterium]|nr:hypothetical protein [Bryobacteraceae bacterium]